MPNSLTAEAGLKLGPIVIETFFKHYLERRSQTSKTNGSDHTSLREQDLLWQESFEVIKSFLNQATRHTVEELQEFSNARIPVAPWIYVKSVLVPLSSCDAAAAYLIKAFGGEEFTKRVVGGTKWWQVRGLRGVDCQWIWQKSEMRASRKRKKTRENRTNSSEPAASSSVRFPSFRKLSNHWRDLPSEKVDYTKEGFDQSKSPNDSEGKGASQDNLGDADGTRCMLYAHGGGYYFGSVDQERYCLQRYARKIKGRVFAVNYRLAPQYPFPCAIQDLLAAYLYLIEPPSDTMHAPISPSLIVLGGDSAGGGLCLAALQVMRDSGIPLPAGAVLISPWCDLTHSFPSTLSNTETDIIPPYGLCLHRPSVLWPPPPEEMSTLVRTGLRERFKAVAKKTVHMEAFLTANPPLPSVVVDKDKLVQENNDIKEDMTKQYFGENVRHLFPEGDAKDPLRPLYLSDPLGSIADTLSVTDIRNPPTDFLPVAGKPPLPWDSSEGFRLVVDKKTITVDSQIQLYCPNNLLAHPLVSPVLSYLGGLPPLFVIASDKEVLRDEIIYLAHKAAHPDRFSVNEDSKTLYPPLQHVATPYVPTPVHLQVYDETAHVLPLFSFTTPAKYCYRAIAAFTKHLTPTGDRPGLHVLAMRTQTVSPECETPPNEFFDDNPQSSMSDIPTLNYQRQSSPSELPVVRDDSGDVAGSRFKTDQTQPEGPDTAGSPSTYRNTKWPSEDDMIRERVSIRGVLRPLEPEPEIQILNIPIDRLGRINEGVARRYVSGRDLWRKKFGNTAKKIEMKRVKNLQLARCETIRTVETMGQLQEHLFGEHDTLEVGSHHRKQDHTMRKRMNSLRAKEDAERHSWVWTWALDGEHPPPTSIVSRRDTVEARNLARVADLGVEQEDSKLSGNMLWSVLVNFLTIQSCDKGEEEKGVDDDRNDDLDPRSDEIVGQSKRSRILRRLRSLGSITTPTSRRGPHSPTRDP